MTGPQTLDIDGTCPNCGTDCDWIGVRGTRDETRYTIHCPNCGTGAWSAPDVVPLPPTADQYA